MPSRIKVLDWTSVLLGFVALAVLYLPFFASKVFRSGPVVELPFPAEAQPPKPHSLKRLNNTVFPRGGALPPPRFLL